MEKRETFGMAEVVVEVVIEVVMEAAMELVERV